MKKCILFLLFILGVSSYAQIPIEILSSPKSDVDNTTAEVVSLYSVGDTITFVQVDIMSKEYKKSFIPRISLTSKLVAGKDSLSMRNIIALKQGTLEPTDDELLGLHYWKDFKENETYSCLVIYEGYIKKGINTISITSEDDNYYSFKGIEIDNPFYKRPSTYHIAYTTANVNLRDKPSVQSDILGKIGKGDILFLDILEEVDGFYKVHVLNSSKEGYVSKKYVDLGRTISKPTKGAFQVLRNSGFNEPPKAEIFNNTDLVLSLTIGGKQYAFKPRSKKKIVLEPGLLYYMASAPGVNPKFGTQEFKKGDEYTWEFIIVTHRF